MKTDEPKISKNRQKKEQIVAEIAEKAGKAKALVFTNYQGLTHKQLEDFKKKLRETDAELMVSKNTLLKLALKESKKLEEIKEDLEKNFQNPTATLFAYSDIIAPLKVMAKIIKELNLPSIKFGIFEDKPISAEQVTKLSTLPSREILLAQLAAGMKGPIYGLHRALSWNMQKLVMTLDAIQVKKS